MKSRHVKLIAGEIPILVAGVLFLTLPLPTLKGASQGRKQVERSLRNVYVGNALRLRNFYVGRTLEFDSRGDVVGAHDVGPWTLYCRIFVAGLKLQSRVLEIQARRVFLHYIEWEKRFEELRDGEVQIRIALDHEPSSTQGVESILTKIFVKSGEDFSALVPQLWKEFCSHPNDPEWSKKQLEKRAAEEKMRDKTKTPPAPVLMTEPTMTDEAREAKINGTVRLSFEVGENGLVSDIMLVTPLGMGLDEKAVETLRNWKFKPAQLDGHATPSRAVAEFNFRTF